jgi:hypothetical protein
MKSRGLEHDTPAPAWFDPQIVGAHFQRVGPQGGPNHFDLVTGDAMSLLMTWIQVPARSPPRHR